MREKTDSAALVVGFMVLSLAIGFLDYVTGPFVSLTLFYLGPVVGASWFRGRTAGVVVAVVAGLASLAADVLLAAAATIGPVMYWNAASRFGVLVVAAFVVDRVRADQELMRTMDAQRSRALQLLDRGISLPAKELVDLAEHWDGSVDQLRALLRPRAEAIALLARDFAEMILLQRGRLTLSPAKLDLLGLLEDVRGDEMRQRPVTLVAPAERIFVLADGARLRQSIVALVALVGRADELFLSLTSRDRTAELVISSDGSRVTTRGHGTEEATLSIELARLMFASQGGTLDVHRNPITRSLRATARLPLA